MVVALEIIELTACIPYCLPGIQTKPLKALWLLGLAHRPPCRPIKSLNTEKSIPSEFLGSSSGWGKGLLASLAWLLQFKLVGVSVFQARAYIINLLILSLSLSDFALANGVEQSAFSHDQIAEAQRQIAGLSLGGRPYATGIQGVAGGMGIRTRFQEWIAKQPQAAQVIAHLDGLVDQVNTEQDNAKRKPMMDSLRKWIAERTGREVTEKDLYADYCVAERDLTDPDKSKPGDGKPQGPGTSGDGTGTTGDDSASTGPEGLRSPVSRDRKVNPELAAIGEAFVGPPRRSLFDSPPESDRSPVRPGVVNGQTGTKPPTRVSHYNGQGCDKLGQGTQTGQQGEADRNANNNAKGDSTGGSPSNDKQSPQGGGGGGGYQSKNSPLKPGTIPEGQPYGQMPAGAAVDGSCMFCSAIAEAGKSKYVYEGGKTVKGIGEDLDSAKAQRDEILAKNRGFTPQALPINRNQRPSTGDALSSAIKKGGAVNPLGLGPTL